MFSFLSNVTPFRGGSKISTFYRHWAEYRFSLWLSLTVLPAGETPVLQYLPNILYCTSERSNSQGVKNKDPHFAKPDDPCYSSFEGQLQKQHTDNEDNNNTIISKGVTNASLRVSIKLQCNYYIISIYFISLVIWCRENSSASLKHKQTSSTFTL